MDINARQEQFANAFLVTVAAVAGFTVAKSDVDHDSMDWTIASRLPHRPKIDIQMKSRRLEDADTDDFVRYNLKRKNYDDLILTNLLTPRLLVLVLMPSDIGNWLDLTADQLVLRRCAYWVSLAGQPATDNKNTVMVGVPRANLLNVAALERLMWRANDQEPL
jgi:hypothetical protein